MSRLCLHRHALSGHLCGRTNFQSRQSWMCIWQLTEHQASVVLIFMMGREHTAIEIHVSVVPIHSVRRRCQSQVRRQLTFIGALPTQMGTTFIGGCSNLSSTTVCKPLIMKHTAITHSIMERYVKSYTLTQQRLVSSAFRLEIIAFGQITVRTTWAYITK